MFLNSVHKKFFWLVSKNSGATSAFVTGKGNYAIHVKTFTRAEYASSSNINFMSLFFLSLVYNIFFLSIVLRLLNIRSQLVTRVGMRDGCCIPSYIFIVTLIVPTCNEFHGKLRDCVV